MNILDNVRSAQNQQFVATLFTPEIVHTGIAELNVSSHRAVIDDDTLIHGMEKIRHSKGISC